MPTEEEIIALEEEYGSRNLALLPWIMLIIIVGIAIYLYLHWGNPKAEPGVKPSDVQVELVKVPNLVGMDGDTAEELLKQLGLTSERGTSYDVVGAPGSVGYQDPDGGSRVEPGTNVFIGIIDIGTVSRSQGYESPEYVAQGIKSRPAKSIRMATVPSVTGLTEDAATRRLESLGFDVRPMYQPRGENVGTVLEQSYDPGTEIPYGGQVHILVVVGYEPGGLP